MQTASREMLSLMHNITTKRGGVGRRTPLLILLADAEAKFLSALRLIIGGEPGLSVVAEATEIEDLRAKLERYLPDLLLLDWEMPDLQRAELIPQLLRRYPAMKIVALSSQPEAR